MTDPRGGTPNDDELDEAAEAANEPAEPVVAGDPVEADPDLAPALPASRGRDRDREARARGARMAAPVASPSDQAVHVDDRISKVFVAATVLVFLLIFLNGMLLGKGGALSPSPTPTPVPSTTATPSGSPVGSASPGASGSASPALTSPSPS